MEILSRALYNQFKIPTDSQIPDESVYQRYGREFATKTACNSGNQQCLDEMLALTQLFLRGEAKIPNGLHGVVLCGGMKASTSQRDWTQLYSLMQETSDATIKGQIITSLGCATDIIILDSYLESSTGDGASFSYTRDERRNVLNAVLNSENGLAAAIGFVEHYELDILRFYEYDLETLVSVLARTVKTIQQQNRFTLFLNLLAHLEAEAAERVRTIIQTNLNVQRQQPNVGHMEKIQAFLAKRVETTTTPTTIPSTTIQPTASPQVSVPTTTAGAGTNQFQILSLLFACFISLKFNVL